VYDNLTLMRKYATLQVAHVGGKTAKMRAGHHGNFVIMPEAKRSLEAI
jgi:hypothetical protein